MLKSTDLRERGRRDALAGRPIEAFYQVCLSKGRHTESARAEYEIGWRSIKDQPPVMLAGAGSHPAPAHQYSFIIRYDDAGKFRLETQDHHGEWAGYQDIAVLCVPTTNGGHRRFIAVTDYYDGCLPANKAIETVGEFDAEVRQ